MRAHLLPAFIITLSLLAACDGGPTDSRPGRPAELAVVSGDGQTGTVGAQLPQPLRVGVADADGRPVPGQVVTFHVVAGGGSVFVGAATTDAEGLAEDRWTLGTEAGEQRVEARVAGTAGAAPLVASITAQAAAAAPAAAAAQGSTTRTGAAGSVVLDSLAVRVADAYGNPAAGVTVAWAVRSGGGTVSPAQSTTDASGVARAQWSLGTRLDGVQTVEATPAGLAPVSFTAAAGMPEDAAWVLLGGDAQEGEVARPLADSLAAALRLPDGRPLQGVAVSWSGRGSFAPATDVTDAEGRVAARWTLPQTSGTLAATVTTGSRSLAFTAEAHPDDPEWVIRGPWGSAPRHEAGDTVTIRVQALDRFRNPVPGEWIHWSVEGMSISPDSSPTGPDGWASALWRVPTTLGYFRAEAQLPGVAGAEFTVRTQAGPFVLVTLEPDSVSVAFGSTSTVPIRGRAFDQYGNERIHPVHGYTGIFTSWTSSDPSVATVRDDIDQGGFAEVRIVGPGRTVITATAVGGASATAVVRVEP